MEFKQEQGIVSADEEILTIGAAEAESQTASTVAEEDDVALTEALALSGLGFGIVFAVLVVLMAFITVMSAIIRGGKKAEKPVQKKEKSKAAPTPAPVAAPVATPVAAPVAAVQGDADMYVSLNGKKHAVSVEEKLPRFNISLNGKTHAVDVESVEEE
ncbi:MAG: OadG family protein [Clostridia bacterium]|nr:OadG family protein [Clostridia bacterium]